ncbi:MAG: energy-coupling factor transporter transmembrane protein EcfT [Oscillospiraceae bacterium]|nr:energy-coupling factor transporter transmembrane protein EcfT [Oscillospiraceae bacterium]
MKTLHPITSLVYFTALIGFAFVFMHPVSLGISLLGALSFILMLEKSRALRFMLTFLLPLFILAAAANLLFSRQGVTILAYLPSGNPLTLESTLFGIAQAAMLASVITWFRGFNLVMTSDKLVYLFGRAAPALALLLSMSLRFVPRFTRQMQAIAAAQRGIGKDVTQGNVLQRARHGLKILSITVTWALENAVETAGSMRARGYGLPGRTAFAIFRWTTRDTLVLAFVLSCAAVIISGAAFGGLQAIYFAEISLAWQPLSYALFAVQVVLIGVAVFSVAPRAFLYFCHAKARKSHARGVPAPSRGRS